MSLAGKKIGFALTGSYCTFDNVFPQIQKLVDEKAEVIPIVSYSVDKTDTRFGKSKSFKDMLYSITGRTPINTIVGAEPIGPKNLVDIVVVAPCTGNTLAKFANAITDTPVLMALKAHLRNSKPVLIAISTNDGLGNNAKNIGALLNLTNVFFVPFFQDSANKKNNSLIADMNLIAPSIEQALAGKQIQPILLSK